MSAPIVARAKSFASGGLRHSGRRRIVETVLRVALLGGLGIVLAFVAYQVISAIITMLLVLLVVGVTILVFWALLAGAAAAATSAGKPTPPPTDLLDRYSSQKIGPRPGSAAPRR